ncbi:hypothetical protein [Streptomyces griseofuscus]|uniref:Uncharacterized protein n=2 Tax=Streptomyces griseofuscus TaxID=146922 RepID=A0A7H1Q3J8_9ACTN|nr:hypothetical protein [Streptomyces griseofuscus]QNT94878.1 hypothetical protein HEP81_04605 [Streptomyces griseofuscus]
MRREGQRFVCTKCGSYFDQGGVAPTRRLVAAGIIARRTGGRSLRLTCTPAGVTGHLRSVAPAATGRCC